MLLVHWHNCAERTWRSAKALRFSAVRVEESDVARNHLNLWVRQAGACRAVCTGTSRVQVRLTWRLVRP